MWLQWYLQFCDIVTTANSNPTPVGFKHCAPFITCITKIDGTKMMLILILFLLSNQQSYMFLSSLYQQKIVKNYQNLLVKDLKGQFIGINIKQEVRIKMQQNNEVFSSNQTLL